MYMAEFMKAGAELFIGTSGYSYPDWKGILYPRSVNTKYGWVYSRVDLLVSLLQ